MSYNGWTNHATWLVNVWFNPESKDDVEYAREIIEDETEKMPPFMRDFLSTDEINWEELLSHFENETTEEVDD